MKVSQERTKGGSISFQATMTGPAAGAEYNMGNKHGHEMNGVPVIEGSSQVDNHKVRWILEEAHDVTYGVRDTWTLPIRMNMNITNNPTLPLSAEFRLECRSPAMFPSLGMSPRTYSLPNSSDESLSLLELSLVDEWVDSFQRSFCIADYSIVQAGVKSNKQTMKTTGTMLITSLKPTWLLYD